MAATSMTSDRELGRGRIGLVLSARIVQDCASSVHRKSHWMNDQVGVVFDVIRHLSSTSEDFWVLVH
jgi:hypothetical protein